MRYVLIIAYAFPPYAGSSGYLRPLALSRYLPRFGWQPLVLSAHQRAFVRVDHSLNADIPDHTLVTRAFALDARRHLGICGRYPLILAQPDRWSSWWLGAVPAGLRLILRYRPTVIWSTSPIVSAHMVAWTLHRLAGVPWVADFRDPVNDVDPGDVRLSTWATQKVERATLRYARRCVFTTAGTAASYAQRYPEHRNRFVVIQNGYDEHNFVELQNANLDAKMLDGGVITLVHSGVLYPHGRNPRHFLIAIAMLMDRGTADASKLQVILRASGYEREYAAAIEGYGVGEVVHLRPPVTYSEALQEQAGASALLLFQGRPYNHQIPAKVYEYLRVGRPIFALVDCEGDTAALLREEGVQAIAPLDDSEAIAENLEVFLRSLRSGTLKTPPRERITRFSREAGTQRFAELFDEVCGGRD